MKLFSAATVFAASVMSWSLIDGESIALNHSESMPVGIYLLKSFNRPFGLQANRHQIKKGNLVAACIPDSDLDALYAARGYLSGGLCPSGAARILKPVAAIAGDLVEIRAEGVAVNGAVILHSQSCDTDSAGRPIGHLPIGWSKRLPSGTYFLLSTYSQRSLDGRYFGPVSDQDLVGRVWPILTF